MNTSLSKTKFVFLLVASILITSNACKNTNVDQITNNENMSPVDPLATQNTLSTGLCGYLHTATLCTNDLDNIKKFYVDGMGMTLSDPISLSESQKQAQKELWSLPDDIDYSYYHLSRETVPSLIQIRLLLFKEKMPSIHDSYNSLELGPFSLGFPNMDQKSLDKRLLSMDIEAMADMQEGTIPRADGTTYRYWETIYKGPDYLHCVGIERGDGMPQLTPCDTITKLGGPGYSAQVIKDSDNYLRFMTEVLDLELRADRNWDASPGSALGIPEGTPFRFALVYAKGSNQNHFLFLDFTESDMIDTGVAPRIPHLGLGAWTLETSDINKILENAKKFGAKQIVGPIDYLSPIYGSAKVLTMHAPNGFLIEVFQKN